MRLLLRQAATVDGGRRLGRWLQAVEPDLVRLLRRSADLLIMRSIR